MAKKFYITATDYFQTDGTGVTLSSEYFGTSQIYFDSLFSLEDPDAGTNYIRYTGLIGWEQSANTNETHKFSVDGTLALTISETEITAAVPFKPASMDTSTRLGLTPADGMIVRDTDLNQIFVYIGGWYSLDMTAEA